MQIIFILYKYKNTHKAPFIPLKQLLLLIETPCTNKSHSLIEWLIDSFILCLPVSVSVCLSVCLSVSSLLFRSVAMCSVGTMYMLQPHMKILHMQCMLMNTAVAILNKQGEMLCWSLVVNIYIFFRVPNFLVVAKNKVFLNVFISSMFISSIWDSSKFCYI